MRRFLQLFALLLLLVCGAWGSVDLLATRWLVDHLAKGGGDKWVDFSTVHVVSPSRVVVRGVRLTDPLTGRVVVRLENLSADLERGTNWSAPFSVRAVQGRQGQLILDWSENALGLSRALQELGRALRGGKPKDPGISRISRRALPTMVFEQMKASFFAPGQALQAMEDCRIEVLGDGDEVRLVATPSDGVGTFLATLSSGRLSALRISALPVSTSMFAVAGKVGPLVSSFRPEGLLTLSFDQKNPDGPLTGSGVLYEASLQLFEMKEPLVGVTLPFHFDGSRFSIVEGSVPLESGIATVTGAYDSEDTYTQIHVPSHGVQASLWDLLPTGLIPSWLDLGEGGSLEMYLEIQRSGKGNPTQWKGHADFLLDAVEVSPAGHGLSESPLVVREVSGQIDLSDGEVILHHVAGRVGAGEVALRGVLNLSEPSFGLEWFVQDVDLAVLHRELAHCDDEEHIGGLLVGMLHLTGERGNRDATVGEGSLSLRKANLWSFPILDRLLSALKLQPPKDENVSKRLNAQFDFRDHEFHFHDKGVRLESNLLSLVGDGHISEAGGLRIDLFMLDTGIPLLETLLEEVIKNFLVEIKLRGTLAEPEVEVIPIRILSKPFGWLFG
ncbi:MAG: hypothetical protein VX916_03165 [Planctomycetota bacterium]|nr:hypothetical protein [Planctomycetota bacterium]